MYKTLLRLVSGANIGTMVQVTTEGAGLHAMMTQGLHCAGVPDIVVETDVGAIRGFKPVIFPRYNDRALGPTRLLGCT